MIKKVFQKTIRSLDAVWEERLVLKAAILPAVLGHLTAVITFTQVISPPDWFRLAVMVLDAAAFGYVMGLPRKWLVQIGALMYFIGSFIFTVVFFLLHIILS